MLTYLYTVDYDDGDAFQTETVPAIQDTDGVVADPSSEPEAVDDETISHHKRMNNVRVYAIAEKYGIVALKKLAKTKFKYYHTPKAIHKREIINAVFDSTPETDLGLRNIVILMSAKASAVEKYLEETELAPVIRDQGSFGLGLLREVVKKQQHGIKRQDLVKLYIEARGIDCSGTTRFGIASAEARLRALQDKIKNLLLRQIWEA